MADFDPTKYGKPVAEDFDPTQFGKRVDEPINPPGVPNPIPPKGTLPSRAQGRPQPPLQQLVANHLNDPTFAEPRDRAATVAKNMTNPKAVLSMLGGIPVQSIQGIYGGLQDLNRWWETGETPNNIDRLASQVGMDPQKLRQDAAQGKWGNFIMQPLTAATFALAAGKGATKLGDVPEPRPVSPVNPARKIMEAIGPADANMNSLEAAVAKSHGNIVKFIRDNNLPLKSRMDYVNAAKAYGEQQKAFYFENVLKPIENEVVNSPSGFAGHTVDQHRTTLGHMEARLEQINAEQANMRNTLNEERSRQALSRQAELTAEAASIRSALNSEIAKRTNLTPEQVSQLRQSFGAPYTIADQTLQTINNETAKGTRSGRGTTTLPEGRNSVVSRTIDWARGGPVKIGDRAFMRASNKYQLEPSHVPEVIELNNQRKWQPRKPVWQGVTSPTEPIQLLTKGIAERLKKSH